MSKEDPIFSVSGKTVLITGGAKGVGLMLTETFLERGSRVCIASRNKNDGEKISKRLKCDFIQADFIHGGWM